MEFRYILKVEPTGFADVWMWGLRKEGVKEGTMMICQSNKRETLMGGQVWGGQIGACFWTH